MKIEVNSIVTLENLESYVVLSETFYQENKYYLMMGLDENKEVISSKVAIFKEEIVESDSYVTQIKDPNLIAVLTKLLKEQMWI